MTEYVVLVDEDDREIGTEEKLQAHVSPALHRALSVIVCDSRGAILIQQRAAHKYHSPGLWSNTCCGHPRPRERAADAARRRLQEEMGVACELQPACAVTYRLNLGNGLFEHELTHVFVGEFEGSPRPDPSEVSEWKWADVPVLGEMRRTAADTLTPWFGLVLDDLIRWAPTAPSLPSGVRRMVELSV